MLFGGFLLYDTQRIVKSAENHPYYGVSWCFWGKSLNLKVSVFPSRDSLNETQMVQKVWLTFPKRGDLVCECEIGRLDNPHSNDDALVEKGQWW